MIKILKRKLLRLSIIASIVALVIASSCNPDETVEPPVVSTFENDVASLSTLFLQSDEILSINSDSEFFYINSTGLASHEMMAGISVPNDYVPVPQNYSSWSIPIKPKYTEEPVNLENSLQSAPIAIAINGVPVYNSLSPSDEFDGNSSALDKFGGHTGTKDDYHYHVPPLHLTIDNRSPFAYALDGFPIYGNLEPDGSELRALDEFNGHEDSEGHFHYHATEESTGLFNKFRGEIALTSDAPSNKISGQPEPVLFRTEVKNYLSQYTNGESIMITETIENENEMGFSINYTVDGVIGTLTYFWDEEDFYTFNYTAPDGTETTQVFER
ncbi:MAG: YHYH protein [Cyclobacteriaceae bacterium]